MSCNNSGLTIPYNYCPELTLLPQEIMDCLIQEPGFIMKIGVSAVSSEVMMQWWEEMILTEPNMFDVAGEGYMVHPMWMKYTEEQIRTPNHIWGCWSYIREMSYNFGWKGYMVKTLTI